MLRVCQSIRTSSLPDKENQAIFAARSPTAIRNIRPLSLRPKQIPETSRSGTWTTRRTRSRFLFDLRFLPSERVSAGMKWTLQPSPDDFSGFCSAKETGFHPEPTPGAGSKRHVWTTVEARAIWYVALRSGAVMCPAYVARPYDRWP